MSSGSGIESVGVDVVEVDGIDDGFNAALLDFDVEGRRATGIEPVRRRWEP